MDSSGVVTSKLIFIKSEIISKITSKYDKHFSEVDKEELNYILNLVNYVLFDKYNLEKAEMLFIEAEGLHELNRLPLEIKTQFEKDFKIIVETIRDTVKIIGKGI
jgi:hypothetical protein